MDYLTLAKRLRYGLFALVVLLAPYRGQDVETALRSFDKFTDDKDYLDDIIAGLHLAIGAAARELIRQRGYSGRLLERYTLEFYQEYSTKTGSA